MLKLIKADFYRILKSKLTIVLLILCFAFVLLSNLSLLLVKNILESTTSEAELGTLISTRSIFVTAYSLTNNIGLFCQIFACIIVCSDLTSGTMRNKIIMGHNRNKIYLSSFITIAVYEVVVMTFYALLNLLFASALFGFGTKFDGGQVVNILKEICLGIFVYIYISSLTTFLCLNLKKTSLAIVLQIVCSLVLFGLYSFATALQSLNVPEIYKNLKYALPVNGLFDIINKEGIYLENDILGWNVLSATAFSALNILLGTILFKNAELK